MTLSFEKINQLVAEMDSESKALKDELFKICWYMRGGVTISEAHLLEPNDRASINKLIDSNIEVTNTTGLPFF